jgi:single-stranded DNA-binding protein
LAGRNEAGERTFQTSGTAVEAWDKLAETCARYIYKRRRVQIVGSLQTLLVGRL